MKILWTKLNNQEKNQHVIKHVMKGNEEVSAITGIFNPMEDLNDAWQIVDKIGLWYGFKKDEKRRMVEVSMGNDLSDGKVITFVFCIRDGLNLRTVSGEAKTLQEAICIASLKAVDIDVQEE